MQATPAAVVSDATPIHYLTLIGEINLLRELYGRIIVPRAVVQELSVARAPAEVRNWVDAMPEWAEIGPVFDETSLPFRELGLGEREAIALARSGSGSILLTDDQPARLAAEGLGIQVVPTIRVLSTAGDLSLVVFGDALRRLRGTNFRISRKVIEGILRARTK